MTADDLYTGADSYVRMTALPDGWEDLPRTARRRIARPCRTAQQPRSWAPHPDPVRAWWRMFSGFWKRLGRAIVHEDPAWAWWRSFGGLWKWLGQTAVHKDVGCACRTCVVRRRRDRPDVDVAPVPARVISGADGQYLEMQFGWKPAGRPKTWVRFPLTHHRRMPADAEVLWVYIHRWRVGTHYEWRAQLTIESATFHRPQSPTARGGTCAIDIGWRRIFDARGEQIGLRVAYLVDEHGREREIRAPDGLWQRLAKVYSIAQIRSKEFDKIRDRLVAWVGRRRMPPWFVDRANGLPQWRAPRKLQTLVDLWWRATSPRPRSSADDEILGELNKWANHDRHLARWEAHMRDRTISHRREIWRQVATDLAHTYEIILVEDGLCRSEGRERQMKIVDIEGWDRPAPEDGDPHEGREQRRQARMAAPGELRDGDLRGDPQDRVHRDRRGADEELDARVRLVHARAGARELRGDHRDQVRALRARLGPGRECRPQPPAPPRADERPRAAPAGRREQLGAGRYWEGARAE